MINIIAYENELPPVDKIRAIFTACKWWDVSDQEFENLFKGSTVTFIAFDGKEAVGTGRIISDGVMYGLFVDVMVIPARQKQGVGNMMVEKMLDFSKAKDLKLLKLIATEKGKGLYEKFGFVTRTEKEPGMVMITRSKDL